MLVLLKLARLGGNRLRVRYVLLRDVDDVMSVLFLLELARTRKRWAL